MNNIESLAKEIKAKKPKRVLLQLPEGLKAKAAEITDAIEKIGARVFLSAEPCYGACDLATDEAVRTKSDLIVHVGHNKFYRNIKSKVPVVYFSWKFNASIDGIDFSPVKEKRIGLVTTAQHMDLLDDVKKVLEKEGRVAVIGGQILGCWTANAERIKNRVDAFLFIGSGSFHPLAVRGRKVYSLDLEKKEIRSMEKEISLSERKRYARIFRAKDAKTFGIIVSTKHGQFNLAAAEKIKKKLEQKDKKAYILIMDKVTDENLHVGVDAFINTACPRIAEDRFSKPVINAEDVDMVIE